MTISSKPKSMDVKSVDAKSADSKSKTPKSKDVNDDNAFDDISKSERKRNSSAKQKLGERLSTLSETQLTELSLSDSMARSVQELRKLNAKGSRAYGAQKRQRNYLGKLLRSLPEEEFIRIETYFIFLDNKARQQHQQFHRLEKWRDRLLADGDEAIEALYTERTDLDYSHRQLLRQLVRQGQKELKKIKAQAILDKQPRRAPKAARQIFKYLRDEIFH